MRHKRIVINANILIRAVLGSRVRKLIEQYSDSVAFYVAEANAKEAEYYLCHELAGKYHLDDGLWRLVFNGVMDAVHIIAGELLIEVENKA